MTDLTPQQQAYTSTALETKEKEAKLKLNQSLVIDQSNAQFFNTAWLSVEDSVESGSMVYESNLFNIPYKIDTRVLADEDLGKYFIALFKYNSEELIAETNIKASEKPIIIAILELINVYINTKEKK